MTTALQLITKAMQQVGILTKNESPSADESADALDTMNDILSSWSNDSLLTYVRVTESFTLTSGVASYTIGSAQTLNTVRPIFIVEAHARLGSIDYPLAVIPDEAYQGFSMKTITGTPQFLNYTNGFPYGTINLYPTPSPAYTLFLTSEKELTQYGLSDTVSLPPGWKRALIFNLAVELAPQFGQQIDAGIMQLADDSKAAITRSIMKNRTMDTMMPTGAGVFNVYRGY